MFLTIMNTNKLVEKISHSVLAERFDMNVDERKEKITFYLFLSFAHVENNKALLKIAFNREKRSVWFTSRSTLSLDTLWLLSLLPTNNGKYDGEEENVKW